MPRVVENDGLSGPALIARIGILLCAAALLWVYFSSNHDPSGDVLFLVALMLLTVAAFFR